MSTDPSSGWFEGREHVLPVRVYYEDTDFTGVVYHANYLRYFERGRSDFLRMAGVSHTDLLAHLTGSTRVAMMFWSEPLKVVLATIHIPLASVSGALTRELVDDIIDLSAQELPRFGIAQPRLAVAGLNPHAGEDGLLGPEEGTVLRPAIEAAQQRGLRIDGPFPGDTVFGRAVRGEFDAVIACYHDQGLIPVKLLAFGHAVNVTLGLPIIRTSVDHGTAFDIAGKNVADPSSMIEATLLAARLATRGIL